MAIEELVYVWSNSWAGKRRQLARVIKENKKSFRVEYIEDGIKPAGYIAKRVPKWAVTAAAPDAKEVR